MKKTVLLFVALLLSTAGLFAQEVGYRRAYRALDGQDTITVIDITPIYVFPRKIDTKRYARLIQNIKKVYPIAKEANATLKAMEAQLLTLKTRKEQEAFVKQMEKQLKAKYTPVLKQMTYAQGKILIKLIDRETSRTSYDLVKELRGSFSAFFYQGIAKLFGANLKETYDRYGEDLMTEILIQLYEAGEL